MTILKRIYKALYPCVPLSLREDLHKLLRSLSIHELVFVAVIGCWVVVEQGLPWPSMLD